MILKINVYLTYVSRKKWPQVGFQVLLMWIHMTGNIYTSFILKYKIFFNYFIFLKKLINIIIIIKFINNLSYFIKFILKFTETYNFFHLITFISN